MTFADAVARLEAAFQRELPGAAAQARLAPVPRRQWPTGFNPARIRNAAGLLPNTKIVSGRERCETAANGAPDCSVAAEALDNLKRLLERKQQLESQLPHLAAGSQPTSASGEADVPASTPQQPLALPPLPLP